MTIEDWSKLELKHLFYAYRKAKVDCFYERLSNSTEDFVEYEKDLHANLNKLLDVLKSRSIDELLDEHLSEPRVVAKKLSPKPLKDIPKKGHLFFSTPSNAFDALKAKCDLEPEFRLVGHFSVIMHVLSALWVNQVGRKYDEKLTSSAYGSRLRRYRAPEWSSPGQLGEYHEDAIGSFYPYFVRYQKWRQEGLAAIRRELENDKEERSVIAISFDIRSYYHNIDPSFAIDESFLSRVGIDLSAWQKDFTRSFVEWLKKWGKKTKNKILEMGHNPSESFIGGIPIGISIAHVLANAFLIEADLKIRRGLTPLFYGRYVDDMFIVIRDPGNIKDTDGLLSFIKLRTSLFKEEYEDEDLELDLHSSYVGESRLKLQRAKQKTFFLYGRAGLDLLDNIESQIKSVSSERRLMPAVRNLESTASARILASGEKASDEADTLRKADGLAVRRLSWSVQLRAVETLSHDLKKEDWLEERKQFYQFSCDHILRADKILDHIDYLPRLISIAIRVGDWADAKRLFVTTKDALKKLRKTLSDFDKEQPGLQNRRFSGFWVNGHLIEKFNIAIWYEFEKVVRLMAKEAILRSFPVGYKTLNISDTLKSLLEELGLSKDIKTIRAKALEFREADLARMPYKEHLREFAKNPRPVCLGEHELAEKYKHSEKLLEFLRNTTSETPARYRRLSESCGSNSGSILPYIFPTRAHTAQEISLLLPDTCIFDKNPYFSARNWAHYVQAVRGVWVWDSKSNEDSSFIPIGPQKTSEASGRKFSGLTAHLNIQQLDENKRHKKVLLGITNLKTTDESWQKGASGKTDISRARYERIECIINHAIKSTPRPTYLILPELALPEQWLDTVSSVLLNQGINLITGLDYHCPSKQDTIYSEAALVLTDKRLGYSASVQIRQPKIQPAPAEGALLRKIFGKTWYQFADKEKSRRLYIHEGFCFGILICSELQNIQYRHDFQGVVDSLMILSWNKDLETFSALIESASLDVHAFIALVNNRQYGDSRVRVPSKEFYKRDVCRLRGGENEYLVVVEINYDELREFQSRATREPSNDDPFKPVPEGFEISKERRAIPSIPEEA